MSYPQRSIVLTLHQGNLSLQHTPVQKTTTNQRTELLSSVSTDTSTILLSLKLREHWRNGGNVRSYTYQVSPDLNKDDTSRHANTDGVRGSAREFNIKQITAEKEGMLGGLSPWTSTPLAIKYQMGTYTHK